MNRVIQPLNNYRKFVPMDNSNKNQISKMQTLKFKTNINCSGCVAKVTNTLNAAVGKDNWSVDTRVPEKTLTVKTASLSGDEIETAIKSVGFKIEEE